MNILYIGEGGEAGAKLVNLLSLKNTVTAVFAEKSVYEIECEVFYRDSDICWLVREKAEPKKPTPPSLCAADWQKITG